MFSHCSHLGLDKFSLQTGELLSVLHQHESLRELERGRDVVAGIIENPVAQFRAADAVNGNTYYYVVTATDTNGNESARSTQVSATPTSRRRR